MTILSDLRTAAQVRADRTSAPWPNADWNQWINASAGALYRALCATYEDYNVKPLLFTLAGGVGGNSITLGAGGAVADFYKLRKVGRQLGTTGSGPYYTPLLRINSFLERDMYASPPMNPVLGGLSAYYSLVGSTLEVLPPDSSAGNYQLWYIPIFTPLAADTDSIDGQWLSLNGIDEWIVVDVARKAMIREESLDTAQLLKAEADQLRQTIMVELSPRDDNQPGRIVDVKKLRANWGQSGWGGSGVF